MRVGGPGGTVLRRAARPPARIRARVRALSIAVKRSPPRGFVAASALWSS